MLTSNFNYNLPKFLIAQSPASPRDSSRLMVIDKDQKTWEHRYFYDIVDYLQKGDLIVWNNSKVFNARLKGKIEIDEEVYPVKSSQSEGRKAPFNGARILNTPKELEIFLVRPTENEGVWRCLAKPGKKLRLGMRVKIAADFIGEVLLKEKDGTILIDFKIDDATVRAKANEHGSVPTPPYIKINQKSKIKNQKLSELYQTIYASDEKEGSVAAPTAGFHFTPGLIEKLENKGVEFAEVTLHVGLGTFLPVKTEKVEEHKMHSEWVELTAKNADKINAAKKEGRRVVAVGTTTVRVLEGIVARFVILSDSEGSTTIGEYGEDSSSARASLGMTVRPYTGDINIFITPGFEFKIVDALITNFHLPQSTLLMLVCAFAGDKLAGRSLDEAREFVLRCYSEAVREKYRFYSFGDAMLIK